MEDKFQGIKEQLGCKFEEIPAWQIFLGNIQGLK
jgi:hypothetical protein